VPIPRKPSKAKTQSETFSPLISYAVQIFYIDIISVHFSPDNFRAGLKRKSSRNHLEVVVFFISIHFNCPHKKQTRVLVSWTPREPGKQWKDKHLSGITASSTPFGHWFKLQLSGDNIGERNGKESPGKQEGESNWKNPE